MTTEAPFITSIMHPSDLSEVGANAFAHALALALWQRSRFTLLHAHRSGADLEWRRAPSVRRTLERWRLLEPDSIGSQLFQQVALDVRKVDLGGITPLQTLLKYLETHQVDLLVVGTEGREGLPRWLRPSFAEQLSRRSKTATLFVPHAVPGLVCLDSGQIHLNRILIPVDGRPDPAVAIAYGVQVAAWVEPVTEISLLHVGTEDYAWPQTPKQSGIRWQQQTRQGTVVDQILKAAEAGGVDLMIMATQGHHGIWDAFRGSTTEQVLRRSPCPVLAVPADLAHIIEPQHDGEYDPR